MLRLAGSATAVGALAGEAGALPPSTYSLEQGDTCIPLVPISGSESVEDFYSFQLRDGQWEGNNGSRDTGGPYYASAGTTDLQEADTSLLFLYDGPDGLSLVLVHEKIGYNPQDGGAVTFSFTGMPADGEWAVKDDLYLRPSTGEPAATNYDNWNVDGTDHTIDWAWNDGRTDGGAFRGLGSDFEITITPAFNEAAALWGQYEGTVEEWQALSGDRSNPERTTLDMTQPVTIRAGGCGGTFDVATTGTTAVGDGTATVAGELTGLGDASEATVYFEYWEQGARDSTTNWWTGEQQTAPGTFTADLTLESGTTYEFRALARDTAGRWKAGTVQSFTTTGQSFDVATTGTDAVDATTATLTGDLTGLGSSDAATVYFTYWQQGAQDSTTNWWTGPEQSEPGRFSAEVGLQRNTTYEFRALAKDTAGRWKAGGIDEFTTDVGFDVATVQPTDVGDRTATVGCDILGLGGRSAATPYVKFWRQSQGESSATWWTGDQQSSTGTFTTSLTLEPGTTYECRALGQADDGTWRAGSVQSFETTGSPFEVTTGSATDVSDSSATLTGDLLGLGGADGATVYFKYWQQGAKTSTTSWWTSTEQRTAPGSFAATVTLRPGTTYEFRALAQDSAGTWTVGDVGQVTTDGSSE